MGKARFCKGKRKDSILSLSQDREYIFVNEFILQFQRV